MGFHALPLGLRTCLSAGCGLVALLGVRPALASESVTVSKVEEWSGDHFIDQLVVDAGGVIKVAPFDPKTDSGGWLTIRANKITVAKGGSIDATGAGFPGVDGAAGTGYSNVGGSGA